eukprot:CAMPEP_0175275616 /NCGR_PEP_ID=MMETSP0093-20121207/48063_1 /TAXON_ID=311494 /ORGANISM="Alexandrium monilatum, Strain CCMP3105" /LENGTH=456 /DNA_ID=CAMNT_0016570503 /DNA_START=83 /DNA_END=1450 /DNA_ORIENTATION=-
MPTRTEELGDEPPAAAAMPRTLQQGGSLGELPPQLLGGPARHAEDGLQHPCPVLALRQGERGVRAGTEKLGGELLPDWLGAVQQGRLQNVARAAAAGAPGEVDPERVDDSPVVLRQVLQQGLNHVVRVGVAAEVLGLSHHFPEQPRNISAGARVLDQPAEHSATEAVPCRTPAPADQLPHDEAGHGRGQGGDDRLDHVVGVRRVNGVTHTAMQLGKQLRRSCMVDGLNGGLHHTATLTVKGKLSHSTAEGGQRGISRIASAPDGLGQGVAVQARRAGLGGSTARRGGLRRRATSPLPGALCLQPPLSCALPAEAPLRAGAQAKPALRHAVLDMPRWDPVARQLACRSAELVRRKRPLLLLAAEDHGHVEHLGNGCRGKHGLHGLAGHRCQARHRLHGLAGRCSQARHRLQGLACQQLRASARGNTPTLRKPVRRWRPTRPGNLTRNGTGNCEPRCA